MTTIRPQILRLRLLLVACVALAFGAGCGSMDAAMAPGGGGAPGGGVGGNGNLGATTGGAQDFRQIRKQIEAGKVPKAEQFLVEGLLSEHDLPLEGAPCQQLLCLNLAAGLAQTRFAAQADAGQSPGRSVLVQVGMSSGLSAETFRRRPQNLALVVDVSGSMSGNKIIDTRLALERLVDRLDEGDLVSIVAFSTEASLRLPPTAGHDKATIKAAIAGLKPTGSTNMEAGLAMGYKQLAQHHDNSARASRLMLFTDAQPNTGRTSAGSFQAQVKAAAADNIGLSAFGVGLSFNAGLIDLMANLRGGNYFYLADGEAIRNVFDKDFDYLVTPLAYDLKLELRIPAGFRFVAAHGVKDFAAGAKTATLAVKTVFLSRNKGAMLVELEQDGSAFEGDGGATVPVLDAKLSYELAETGAKHQDALAADLPRAAFTQTEASYSQPAVRKAVALVSEVNAMQIACERYWANDKAGAKALLQQLIALLEAHQTALGDTSLQVEIDLVKTLSANML